jgi:putative toxin-antitoxin system antitoxin component (TIGR02293 family)
MVSLSAYADLSSMPASESARVANLLGLDVRGEFGDVDLARKVTHGLPTRSVRALAELLGGHLSRPLVPEATLRRITKSRKPLPREHSERVYELGRVIDAVSTSFHGDRQQIIAFLGRPHPLLDGETPLEMARSSSAGAVAVLNLLHRADAGVTV